MEFELKEAQISQLTHLRNHKRGFLIKAFLGFLILFLFSFGPVLLVILLAESAGASWFERHLYQIIGFAIIALIVYKLVNYFFIKTIGPLNRDIKYKIGVIEKHQIIRKQHFPITNDHFFFFAEMEIPNIPIDALTYKHYQAGDYFTIHKAKYSKVVFEDIDRQEINTEYEFEDTGMDVLDHLDYG